LLYADDDIDDQEMIRDMMYEINPIVEVVCLNNGAKVIEFLDGLSDTDSYPCLIVLDLNMPGLGGLATLQKLKGHQTYSAIPVVMYTTSNNVQEREYARVLGVEEFITKPVETKALEDVIHKFASLCHTPDQTFPEAG